MVSVDQAVPQGSAGVDEGASAFSLLHATSASTGQAMNGVPMEPKHADRGHNPNA